MSINTLLPRLSMLLAMSLVVSASCLIAPADAMQSSKLQVGEATTLLTKPLNKNGDVDYAKALNDRMSVGVTPENNAVVWLLKAAGPSHQGIDYPEEIFQKLGMAQPPAEGVYFVDFRSDRWRKSHPEIQETDDLKQRDEYTRNYPWSAEDFPLVADWLEESQESLELIRKASRCPRYYYPLVVTDQSTGLLSARRVDITLVRNACWSLLRSAQRKIKAKDIAGASEDILATYRLSRLVGSQGQSAGQIVARMIDRSAAQVTAQLAVSGHAHAEQLMHLRDAIASLPPHTTHHDSVANLERYYFPDAIQLFARNGKMGSKGLVDDEMSKLICSQVDWNEAATIGNGWYQKLLNILQIESLAERREAIWKFEDQMETDLGRLETITAAVKRFGLDRKQNGRVMAELMLNILLPVPGLIHDIEVRDDTKRRLAMVSLELAAYRSHHLQYPKKLADLVRVYRDSEPTDVEFNRPLKYRRVDQGFQLYSVGRNGEDENGASVHDDTGDGDDVSLSFANKSYREYVEDQESMGR